MTDEVRRMVVPDSDRDLRLLGEIAEEYGLRVETVKVRFDPVSAAFLVGAAALVIAAASDFYERRQGGQVIDLRPQAEHPVRRTVDLQYGLIVVFAKDGTFELRVHDPRNQFADVVRDVLRALITLQAPDAEEAEHRAIDASGDRADVNRGSDEPPPTPSSL